MRSNWPRQLPFLEHGIHLPNWKSNSPDYRMTYYKFMILEIIYHTDFLIDSLYLSLHPRFAIIKSKILCFSCEIIISTTTSAVVPMMEQILTSVKTTASTKPTFLSTITLSTTASTVRRTSIVAAISTLPTTTTVLSTKATTPSTTITSTTNTMDESKTRIATTIPKPDNIYKNMTLSDISSVATYNPVNDKKTDIHLIKSTAFNQTKAKDTFKTVATTTTLSTEPTTLKIATEHKMLLTSPTERVSTAITTILTTVIPKTPPMTERTTTNTLEKTTIRTETTRQPELTVRQPTTIKFKPKEIWIRPAQKGESPIIESKVKTDHEIPHSRSKTREVSTAATTPKTIVVSIIPTSDSYTSFKRIALTTALQTSQKINASIKPNVTQSMDQSFTKPITVKTTTSTPFTIKVSTRKPNSSTSINTLLLQNVTRAKSYTSFSTKGTFKANTLPAAPTTNSMTGTWNANKKLNSSLLTLFSPSPNANPSTRKQTTTSEKSINSHTTIKTDSTLETVSTRTTTAYHTINEQYVTVAQSNITTNSITSKVTEVPQVTKTLVRKQADTNVSMQNLTNTNAKTNTVTEDPTRDEETFHILTEPEHITAVMGDKEKDRSSVDLISVISIAGGVMMAVITVAVVIVMVERCKKPRYEDVRKYNDIRMQVMIDNNDVPPPPYVRSIFHTPLPGEKSVTELDPYFRHVAHRPISSVG